MDERMRQRVAKNEALFRDVNERVREIDDSYRMPVTALSEYLCECGDGECLERVALTREEYERVRAHQARFAIAPGHEIPAVERVVDRSERFFVVEKVPREQDVGGETDPRA